MTFYLVTDFSLQCDAEYYKLWQILALTVKEGYK